MALTCECDSNDELDWTFYQPKGYTPFPTLGRRKRCCSCKELINHGELCAKFPRNRRPKDDIEDKIYGVGEDIGIAALWQCERCSDLYFSLVELGYECINPDDNMLNLCKEYADTH